MLLINCYTCPVYKTRQIQAHKIQHNKIVKSYSKMSYDSISLFSNYNHALLVNVNKASELSKVNFVNLNKE